MAKSTSTTTNTNPSQSSEQDRILVEQPLAGNEAAFRQELALFVVMIPVAFWLGENAVERALLAGSCLLVLVVELLNSSVEAVVDRVGSERHELAGRAKDLASAAVFVSLCLMLVCWVLVAVENLL